MNLLGRVLIVAIALLSVLFMAFAMAVYTGHTNWRDEVNRPQDQVAPGKPLGLKPQFDKAKQENDKLKAERDRLEAVRNAERDAKIQAIVKLENELKLRSDELKALEAKLTELQQQQRQAVAEVQATQAQVAQSRTELGTQRAASAEAEKDRDAKFKRVNELTDQLNQAQNEKDLLKNRADELAKDLERAKQVMRKFGG